MNDTAFYPIGKLPQAALLRLLTKYTGGAADPRVILGPGVGRDAAVLDFGERYLVAKSDPITFATDEIGWYCVHVNANDIACLGAQPRWFLATLLLPSGKSDQALVERIFAQIADACADLGATLVGGHTEVTHGLERPLLMGTMLGDVSPEALVRSDGARPGDALLLTKGIAVEGTALLAREWGATLRATLAPELLERAAGFLHAPGISVVRDATLAAAAGRVHAMHDPTEGGFATGVWELTEAAGVGACLDAPALPIYPETRALCAALGLDPLGLIASGALLIAADAADAPAIAARLQAEGIPVAIIGTVTAEPGVRLCGPEGERSLPRFARDELARLYD